MTSLILDVSPVFYRWTFSTTDFYSKRNKKDPETELYNFEEYKDAFIFRVVDYLSNQKARFGADELILAVDTKPYWRKELHPAYKYGRKENDTTGIDWVSIGKAQNELLDVLDKHSSMKVIRVRGAEGDDVGFVLSEVLSKKGYNVINHTVDHDWTQNIIHPNVKVWETKYNTPTRKCGFVTATADEIKELQHDHVTYGDPGDYIFHIDCYTKFSDKFKEIYPNMTEDKAWPRRFEIDLAFEKKHGTSAYKHPRLGKKSLEKKLNKQNITHEDYVKQHPLREKNRDFNAKLVLPSGIPDEIRQEIIESYNNANTERNEGELIKYFMSYGMMTMVGKVGLL